MRKIKYLIILIIFALICSSTTGYAVFADDNVLYLGGMPAGFCLEEKGACIVGLCDVITEVGLKSPAKEAGIMIGDVIISIDGINVNNAEDIENVLINEQPKDVQTIRKNEKINLQLVPALDISGEFKLGVFIREGVNGIGTITFINGNRFASLGHPVIDDNGRNLEITGGKLYNCNITGYVKGERGNPGELRGIFLKNKYVAKIEKNLDSGVYGKLTDSYNSDKLLKIEKGKGKIGSAFIYTTIEGSTPKKYEISIVKAESGEETVKNYVIKITDKNLIEKTGGIVQGMSGSPIVQDGKLVGAITHVFINDPTRGFGISIENMINN